MSRIRSQRNHAPRLTPAQRRVCDAIEKSGTKIYNGRKGKTLRKLRALGLIEFDYEIVIHVGGSTERYTARLANKPGQPAAPSRRRS